MVKTSTRVKTINGNEYLYEITYYYDKESKRTRQKSKYLGKNVNGIPVKVREQSRSPKGVYSLGEFLPYRQAYEELDLETLLRKYFTPTEIKIILGIVFSGLTNVNALYNPTGWYEGTAMYLRNPSLKFSNQVITKLLQKIGSSQIPFLFCQNLLHFLDATSLFNSLYTAVYDISIDMDRGVRSSELYHDSISGLEPEYENITVIYDVDASLPVFYAPCNQPIPGTSSCKEALSILNSLGLDVQNTLLVQNRSGYTAMNLHELHHANTPYILPISMDVTELQEFEKHNQEMLMHPSNLNIYDNNSIFVLPFNIELSSVPVQGYLYYSPQKDESEQKRIYENLRQICDRLDQSQIYPGVNPSSTVKEVAGSYEPFIGWRIENNKLDVSLKTRAISKHVKKLGRFAILYSGADLKWDECLSHYDLQAADRHFMMQLMERKRVFPYGTHTRDITQGTLFVSYLSLLLRRWVLKRMKKAGLLSMYTPEKIFLELEKIKLIEFTSRKITPSDLTAKQKEILTAMKVEVEY
jgi:hypothetical protein